MNATPTPAGAARARFAAVAFDLDGTLYPDRRLFLRLVPFLLKNHRLLKAMGRARDRLRKSAEYEGDFYGLQARLMGEILGEDAEIVREKADRLIYRGWEPFFTGMKLFPHLRETLDAFRSAGIPMGILSDFPPETKLKNMGLAEYWDVMLGSEESGRLKPDPLSFLELARRMGQNPQDILYVGNKSGYDVAGAHAAGMKAALIIPWWKKRLAASGGPVPDFAFSDYRQLRDFVIQ
ncbi:MAG: HAD family hydrolase [Treponema sp.]|nr:HAD family hydrolase [Treponema sp.]